RLLAASGRWYKHGTVSRGGIVPPSPRHRSPAAVTAASATALSLHNTRCCGLTQSDPCDIVLAQTAINNASVVRVVPSGVSGVGVGVGRSDQPPEGKFVYSATTAGGRACARRNTDSSIPQMHCLIQLN
ncbi:unnamed protein product, partial [Meganyctiphanes norvegica]